MKKNTARVVYGAYHASPHYISLCRHKHGRHVADQGKSVRLLFAYKSCGNDTVPWSLLTTWYIPTMNTLEVFRFPGTRFFNYSEDYLKSSIEESLQDSGYDAEVQSANVTYRGLLSGNKINNGKIRGNVKCLIQDTLLT